MISIEYASPINCCAQLQLDEFPQSLVVCCRMAVLLLHFLIVDNQVGSFLDNFLIRWSNGSLFKPWYGPLQIREDNLVWEELAHPFSAVELPSQRWFCLLKDSLNRFWQCLFLWDRVVWSRIQPLLPPHHKHCSLWWFTKFCLHSS